MNKILAFFLLTTILPAMRLQAQAPEAHDAADMYLQLQKLNVLGSVLYIGAHPDDENTRLLAWLSKEKKYRTAYLSLTRGDGGQNLIGDEQGVPLGLIRTQELLAARRIDGAEQFFSTAYDFGFSKNPEETFKIWDKQKILSDVVWVIRKFRPDVIITRFPEDGRAGHGHHSASAILAREAFYAAGDTTRFPEQFAAGVTTWKPKRLLWNTYNFGNNNTIREGQFRVEVGGYNPVIGKSYGEVAAQSRSQHKSQGFGVAATRGEAYEYFETVAGDAPKKSLMDGVDVTWKRTGEPAVANTIDSLLKHFQPTATDQLVPALVALKEHFRKDMNIDPWVRYKTAQIDQLLTDCMGLYFEATTSQPFAVTDDSLQVTFTVINRSHVPVGKAVLHFSGMDTSITFKSLTYDKPQQVKVNYKVKASFMQDQPYWLRDQMEPGGFTVKSQQLIGLPENPHNDVSVSYTIEAKAGRKPETVQVNYPLLYKSVDPVKGEQYQPVITVPQVLVTVLPSVILNNLVPAVRPHIKVQYQSLTDMGKRRGSIVFDDGESVMIRTCSFMMDKDQTHEITLALDTVMKITDNVDMKVSIGIGDTSDYVSYGNNLRLIRYDHIPTVHYLYQSKVKVINDEVRVEGKKIGYIKGAGDYVADALLAMGYEVVMLEEKDLVPEKLKDLDAIITGVRAYNVNDYLGAKHAVLMDYIKNGGNLIVQYNTNNRLSTPGSEIGPYDFMITRNRVTDEHAKVDFLLPDHPVLNYPNKITQKDFDNWIQERGTYFAETSNKAFEMPLSMADPNEPAQKGSLLIANYGKGTFVYTGLVFFRELPAGVPGAYRLLANIIALNKKKSF